MAFINCRECGKEISDQVKVCVHCGYNSKSIEPTIIDRIKKIYLMKKKLFLFTFVGLLIVVFGIIVIPNITPLSNEEEYALNNAQSLKNSLKDPTSFVLYDDIIVVNWIDEENKYNGHYTYINYGGKNSYGGMVRNTAVYLNYKYVCSEKDWDKDYLDLVDNYPQFFKAQQVYMSSLYGYNEDSLKKISIIKAKKIVNRLK